MFIHPTSPDPYVFVFVSQPTKLRAEFVTTGSGVRAYALWRRKGRGRFQTSTVTSEIRALDMCGEKRWLSVGR